MKERLFLLFVLFLIIILSNADSRTFRKGAVGSKAVTPTIVKKTHDMGNIWLTVTNRGFFGSANDWTMPSCEFPAHSGIEYLFWGGLWIGAIVDTTMLVSVGCDGWSGDDEMYPSDDPGDTIIVRSTRTNDSLAISEQDYIATYTDTLTDPEWVGIYHHPLHLKVIQKSYAWSYPYAQDMIILDYALINIGQTAMKEVYMGLYVDADCGPTGAFYGQDKAQDDVTGFRLWRDLQDTLWPAGTWYYSPNLAFTGYDSMDVGGQPKYQAPAEYIRTAWIADASGTNDSISGSSPPTPGVSGVRILRTPNPKLKVSYNWWISDRDAVRDWGPTDTLRYPNDKILVHRGNDGTPDWDIDKYLILSNGAFDPDQITSGIRGQNYCIDDTRYLLSFGPVYRPEREATKTFEPGDTVYITLAYLAGENFHKVLGEMPEVGHASDEYYNFEDFSLNASWSYRVFDNPGVDTDTLDNNHTKGSFVKSGQDTVWLQGDGVPDFSGPPPPDAPHLKVVTENQRCVLLWDDYPERPDYKDPFQTTNYDTKQDFEGYRIYRAYSAYHELDGFSILVQYDKKGSGSDTSFADSLHFHTGLNNWPPSSIDQYPQYKEKYPGYKYVYIDEPVLNNFPQYYAITSFDFGVIKRTEPDSLKKVVVPSLECSPYINLTRVMVGPTAKEVTKKVKVVPNPYKNTGIYNEMRWENADRRGWSEHTRRIDFVNLPSECIIRIFTLGGDLVATIQHPSGNTNATETSEPWNLLSRDVQAIVSGIYLFSVEEKGKVSQVGKFVIIK